MRKNKFILLMLIASLLLTGAGNTTSSTTSKAGSTPFEEYSLSKNIRLGNYEDILEDQESIESEALSRYEKYLDTLIAQYPEYEISNKKTVEKGDTISIDLSGYVENETTPSIVLKDYYLQVGGGTLPGEIEGRLPGKKVGNKIETYIAACDYNNEYKDYNITFHTTINHIVKPTYRKFAEVDDDFVKAHFYCTYAEFMSLLESDKDEIISEYKKEVILERLKNGSDIFVPVTLAKQKADQQRQLLIRQMFHGDVREYAATIEDYIGYKDEQYSKIILADVIGNIKTDYLYLAIAKSEEISTSGQGFTAYANKTAKAYGFTDREKIYRFFDTTYETGEQYLKTQYLIEAVDKMISKYSEYESIKEITEDTWGSDGNTVIPHPKDGTAEITTYLVPPSSGFKSYMAYTKITSKSSSQYKLQQTASTAYNGIRVVDGRYCMALGTHFGLKIGQYFDLVLKNGTVIKCILGDVKSDKDTDINHIFTPNGCCSEFIVDTDVLPSDIQRYGDVSLAFPSWKSPVADIVVYDDYAVI